VGQTCPLPGTQIITKKRIIITRRIFMSYLPYVS
jgi:hypothetical protein